MPSSLKAPNKINAIFSCIKIRTCLFDWNGQFYRHWKSSHIKHHWIESKSVDCCVGYLLFDRVQSSGLRFGYSFCCWSVGFLVQTHKEHYWLNIFVFTPESTILLFNKHCLELIVELVCVQRLSQFWRFFRPFVITSLHWPKSSTRPRWNCLKWRDSSSELKISSHKLTSIWFNRL
jgi:hypothetical protein